MKIVSGITQPSQMNYVGNSETKKASGFGVLLAAARSNEDVTAADEYDDVEPAGVHRSKNVCYFGGDVIFPPEGTSKAFMKAWDEMFETLGPIDGGEVQSAIMQALVYGDYHYGAYADDSDIRAAERMKTMSFEEIIQLAIDGQKHFVEDSAAAGVEQKYLDIYNYRVKNIENFLSKWLQVKPDDDVVDLLLKDKEDK